MRACLASRIPPIQLVASMTAQEVANATNEGWLHATLVLLDMTAGKLFRRLQGANEPDLTISSRTGLSLRYWQGVDKATGHVYTSTQAPLGSLLIGAMLEAIEPNHLCLAIRADYARARRVQLYLTAPPT